MTFWEIADKLSQRTYDSVATRACSALAIEKQLLKAYQHGQKTMRYRINQLLTDYPYSNELKKLIEKMDIL